jgi:hypothetical protein
MLLAIALVGDIPTTAQGVPDEYRLKAAFLYQFPQFVEWPSAAVATAGSIGLCVTKPSPFGAALEQLIRGESLSGRPLAVREISGTADLHGCHVLFAGGRRGATDALLKATVGRPILTVGDSDQFLDAGGIIVLRMVNRRVRFEVNVVAARTSGLRISPQLLDLALRVRGGPS